MITYSIIQKSQLEGAHRLDAEYFQPEYLSLMEGINLVRNQTLRDLGCKVVSGPFGSSLKSEAYLSKGVPFIRINDLRDFFINEDDLIYISDKDNIRIKQSQLSPYDLVLSKVGNTIGIVSVVPEKFGICNISENNIGIKFRQDLTEKYKLFILTFLNSSLGLKQVLRSISGNAQPKLNVQDVASLVFPVPSDHVLDIISYLINNAAQHINDSRNYYRQAEDLLLEELGLKDFQEGEDLSFVVNFSDVKNADRIDAEYFQPKYKQLIDHLKSRHAKLLGDLVSMKKGFEPGSEAYLDEGKLFIRVSSLSKFGIESLDQKYLSDDLYNKLKKECEPQLNEILLTKDATPGIAYVIKELIEGIISGGILRLKIKYDIEPEYLALCISSIVGKWQAERDAGGSVIAHWKPEQIKNLLIPVLAREKQEEIAELVKKSHGARKKSKELLGEAKRKVEEMIEKGGN